MELLQSRYKDHIRSVGIKEDEPVYRYFVFDRFHDSQIFVRNTDLSAKTITFAMYDIYTMDQATADGVQEDFSREDFLTEVCFKQVSSFEVDVACLRGKTEHYLSEVDRKDGKTTLILYIRGQNYNDRMGKIILEYEQIEVEDISPRVNAKYFPDNDEAG